MSSIEVSQAALFDYTSLYPETRVFVQEKALAIHARLKRAAEDVIAIGQDLIEVKLHLGHGQFLSWLQAEFEMTDRHARNFMNVASRFSSKSEIISDLPVTVIYALAAPSTPDTVIEMVATGQIEPTLPAIREAKQPSFSLIQHGMGQSDVVTWNTPREVIERVITLFGEIDLDPCSNSHDTPNVPARTIYTEEDDGLAQKWHGKIYLNPPYGNEIGKWVKKLLEEYEQGRVEEAVALLPGRVDTIWFQPLYQFVMCNVRGRLKFSGAENSAPFPSVIVYLGKRVDAFIEAFKDAGPIMGRANVEEMEEDAPADPVFVPSEESDIDHRQEEFRPRYTGPSDQCHACGSRAGNILGDRVGDFITSTYRGYLCTLCSRIAYLNCTSERLRQMADYLDRWG